MFFNFFKRKKKENPRSELKKLLGSYEISTFPNTVMKVLDMLRDPDVSLNVIGEEMLMDPGMHIKMLRMVNSAAFGLASKVSNIKHAVTITGRARLESVVLSFAVSDNISAKMECIPEKSFWLAAARRACLAKLIAQKTNPSMVSECFTAGLLQDMAIPVLAQANKKIYTGIIRKWHASPATNLLDLERGVFGYDHASIGGLMATNWGLPDFLVNAIAGHHDFGSASPAPISVRLTSFIRYYEGQENTEFLVKAFAKVFKLEIAKANRIIERAFSEADEFSRVFYT
jgi:HD-like signal output (HDOD) protein